MSDILRLLETFCNIVQSYAVVKKYFFQESRQNSNFGSLLNVCWVYYLGNILKEKKICSKMVVILKENKHLYHIFLGY